MSLMQLLLSLCCVMAAHACRCIEPTIARAFENADVVVQATLLRKLRSPTSTTVAYSAQIIKTWKGCRYFLGSKTITITTATESAACGVQFLKLGTPYLFSGFLGETNTTISINTCSFQAPWASLTADQIKEVKVLSSNFSSCSCTPTSCGPQLGLPNYLCPDGVTVAGPGPCTYNPDLDVCAWKIVECPCPPKSCGPALGLANVLCPDGVTVAGPGPCEFNPDLRVCAWKIVQCPTCQSDSECATGQYCAAGQCRPIGTCGSNIDCLNPSNPFVTGCFGLPVCTQSKCVQNCKLPCPDGSPLVNCFAQPCAVTQCNEPYVSCADNYCGGCNAYFFNASGYQVCV